MLNGSGSSQAQVASSGAYPLLTLVSAAHGITHMYATLLPLTFPLLIEEFGVSYTLLGALMGGSILVGGLCQFPAGFVHRFVPGRFLIGGGNVLLGLCTIWGGLAPNWGHYSAARWAAMLVTSPQHPVGAAMVSAHFGRSLRGLALAITSVGGNAGSVVVPILGALLIVQLGWRETMLIFGVPGLIVGLMVVLFARETEFPRRRQAKARQAGDSMLKDTIDLFRSRTVALIMGALLIAAGGRGLGTVLNYLPPYLGDPNRGLGLSTNAVGLLYTVLLAGSVIGPVALGRLSDRLGVRKPVVVGAYLVSALAVLSIASLDGRSWLLPVVILIFGFSVFSESSLLQAFLADIVEPRSRNIMFGVYFAVAFGITSLWLVIQGWIIDNYGFLAMFMAMAGSYVLAAILVLGTREPSRERSVAAPR